MIRLPGRTAGDVLNDIGSMLADLTDELDAMLQLEREEIMMAHYVVALSMSRS